MIDERKTQEWEQYVKNLGLTLQRERIAQGYSQEFVATSAGISGFTYRKLEHGESNPGTPANPRLRTLIALGRVLDIPIGKLLPE